MSIEEFCCICKRSSIYDFAVLYPLPKQKCRRSRWFSSCETIFGDNDLICEIHFDQDNFRVDSKKQLTLAPFAVPTLNLRKHIVINKWEYEEEKSLMLAEEPPLSEFINEEHFDDIASESLKEGSCVEESEGTIYLSSKAVQTGTNTCGLIEVVADKCYTINCFHCVKKFELSMLQQFVAHVEASHNILQELGETIKEADADIEKSYDLNIEKEEYDSEVNCEEISEELLDISHMQSSLIECGINANEGEFIPRINEPEPLLLFSDSEENEQSPRSQVSSPLTEKKKKRNKHRAQNNEIVIGVTPHEIIMDFLEFVKAKPVLWQLDHKGFIQEFKLAKKELTRELNQKWPGNGFTYKAVSNSLIRIKSWFRSRLDSKTSAYTEKRHRRVTYFDKCSEFLTKAMLNESTPTYACDLCESVFMKERFLEQHKYLHNPVGKLPFECPHCDQRFENSKILRKHKQSHRERFMRAQKKLNPVENMERLVCDVCGKSYVNAKALKRHKHIHEPPRYKCKICQKEYMYLECLKAHLRTHANQRDFFCDVCGKTFIRKTNLRQHQRVHVAKKKQRGAEE